MTIFALLLLMVAALLAFSNWKEGFLLVVLTGLLQDPLRKIVPDQPVYFTVFVGVVFAAVLLSAYSKGVPLHTRTIPGWSHFMSKPIQFFLVLILLQAVHSFLLFTDPIMTGIGLMVWLTPLPALVLAYQFALRVDWVGVRRLLRFYCILAGISLIGIYLEFTNVNWEVLGEVGEGLKIFDQGTILKAYSGFFRSSEIAAWHAVTISAFVFVLMVAKRLNFSQLVKALALVTLLVSLGMLTGRRKMLIEVVFFLSFFFLMIAVFQLRSGRLALYIGVVGLLIWGAVLSLPDDDFGNVKQTEVKYQFDENSAFKSYTVRSQTGFGDVYDRFIELGLGPIAWAIGSHGLLGTGLGTGSQRGGGKVNTQVNSGAAEGGLGKITLELGLPGLLIAVWLMVRMVRFVRWVLTETTRLSGLHARVAYGLAAFLIAKVASFSMASQAYSDMFVMILMGCSLGFLLAMPTLAARSQVTVKQTVVPQLVTLGVQG